jgi:Lipocalin-like domain
MLKKRFVLMALALAAAGCTPHRQTSRRAASPLVGTWTVRAMETMDSAGRTIDSSPSVGMINYTPEGRMAVQIMVLPRPVVPPVPEGPGEVKEWGPDQARQVVETYDAYFGTYEVDEVKRIVTHHVQGELRPNLLGAAFPRRYEVEGDRLLLSSTNPDQHWRVVWERVK